MKYIVKIINRDEKYGYMLPLEEKEVSFEEMTELVNYRKKDGDEVYSNKILLRHMDSDKMIFVIDENDIKAFENTIFDD